MLNKKDAQKIFGGGVSSKKEAVKKKLFMRNGTGWSQQRKTIKYKYITWRARDRLSI